MDILICLGRLERLIYVPYPGERTRELILKTVLQKCPLANDIDLTYLAKMLNNFTGADLVELCQRTCDIAFKEFSDNEAVHEI